MLIIMKEDYTNDLLELSRNLGAILAGVADLKKLSTLTTYPDDLLKNYTNAISIAVSIPTTIIDSITVESPGEIYVHFYKTTNSFLDHITFQISEKITDIGYISFAIPSSLSIRNKRYFGHASHKAFAREAGLGWIGKNLLLISPQYGPRIRLATILTNVPLIPGKPIVNQCGSCSACIDSCPVKAILISDFRDYPLDRSSNLKVKACNSRLEKFEKMSHIGVSICGICIKACPFGRT
jgi:epoxyqueuosine reductase QueG